MQKLGREIKEFLKEFDFSDLSWSVPKERRFEIDFSDLEDEEIYDISGEEWGAFSPDTDKNKISFLSLFKTWKNQMKVYLVFSGEYEDEQLHGVFASLEDAERAKFLLALGTEENNQEWDIQEWEVKSIPPLPKLEGKYPFKVSIHSNREYPIYVEKGWDDYVSSLSSVEETCTFSQGAQRYEFYIFASDKEDAKKIALTKFLNIGSSS